MERQSGAISDRRAGSERLGFDLLASIAPLGAHRKELHDFVDEAHLRSKTALSLVVGVYDLDALSRALLWLLASPLFRFLFCPFACPVGIENCARMFFFVFFLAFRCAKGNKQTSGNPETLLAD